MIKITWIISVVLFLVFVLPSICKKVMEVFDKFSSCILCNSDCKHCIFFKKGDDDV
jgi:hypothetical protein